MSRGNTINRVNKIERISFIPTQTIEMFNYNILPKDIKEYYEKMKTYSFIKNENGFYDLRNLLLYNKENKYNFIYNHDILEILDIKNNYIITGIKDTTLKNDRILYVDFKKDNWTEKLLYSINSIINKIYTSKEYRVNLKFYILMKDKDTIFINNKGQTYSYNTFKEKINNKEYKYEPYIPLNFDMTPTTEIVKLFKELYKLLNDKSLVEYNKEINNYNKVMILYNYEKLEDDIVDSLKINTRTIYTLKGCYFITNKIIDENDNIYDSTIPIIGTLEILNKEKELYRFKIISLKNIKVKKNIKILNTIDIYIKQKWNFITYTYKVKDLTSYKEYDTIFLTEKGNIELFDNISSRSGILTSKKLYRDYNKDIEYFYIPKFYNIEYNPFKKIYKDKGDISMEGLEIFSDLVKLTKYIDITDIKKKDTLNNSDIEQSISEFIKIIMKNNNNFYIRNIKNENIKNENIKNENIKNENIFYKYSIIYNKIENIENIFKDTTKSNIFNIINIKDNYKEYFNPTIIKNIKLKNIDYIVFVKLELFKKNINVKLDCNYTIKNIKKYFKKVILNGGNRKKTTKKHIIKHIIKGNLLN